MNCARGTADGLPACRRSSASARALHLPGTRNRCPARRRRSRALGTLDGSEPARASALGVRHQDAGPILRNKAAAASEITSASYGPVFGVICRKYWSSAAGSRGNCTPEWKPGQVPRRKMLNQVCSSRAGASDAGSRAASGAAAPRLVDEVDAEAAAQEQRLEPFPAVGRRFPGLGRLTRAVPEDQGQLAGVRRHLVEDVGVIAVEGLPSGSVMVRPPTAKLPCSRIESGPCGLPGALAHDESHSTDWRSAGRGSSLAWAAPCQGMCQRGRPARR